MEVLNWKVISFSGSQKKVTAVCSCAFYISLTLAKHPLC